MSAFSFKKEHRLTLRNEIDTLFRQGKAHYSGPLRLIYKIGKNGIPGIKILISVPRKKFKKAVDRNRLKRLIREAYRLNRPAIIPDDQVLSSDIRACLIYTGDRTDLKLNEMERWVIDALKYLAKEITTITG